MSSEEHEKEARDAIKAAEEGDPEQSAAAQVYATLAVAHALLAVREEIKSMKIRLS